jgi:uncharacterized membrane protein
MKAGGWPRAAGAGDIKVRRKARAEMKLRIGFSVALVAVLFGVWLLLSKPTCGLGFKASLVSWTSWTCVAP